MFSRWGKREHMKLQLCAETFVHGRLKSDVVFHFRKGPTCSL